LKIFSRPDHPWVYRSCSLTALPAIERSFEGKLNKRNQVIQGHTHAGVLPLLLQVDKAVFHSEAVLQHVGMAFNVDFALARLSVGSECARARAGGDHKTDDARDRERTKERKALRQIAHALAKKESG